MLMVKTQMTLKSDRSELEENFMKKISLSKFVGFLRISGTALSLLALAAPEILAKEAVETDDSVKESSVQKESPTQKIYYVDMQKALQSVSAGKKAKAQLEKEYNSKKEKLQAEETKIKEESEAFKKATESFKKQSDVMNEEGRAKKQA